VALPAHLSAEPAPSEWRASRRILFAVIFLVNVVNDADRDVLRAVTSEIKAGLRLSDTQIGLIGTAFLLVYVLAALAVFLGSRPVAADRRRVLEEADDANGA
jgi:sugar phosphate permease